MTQGEWLAWAVAALALAWALAASLRSRAQAKGHAREVADLGSSLASYRSIAENSPDLISRFDRSHKRLYANTGVETLLNKPRDKLVGMSLERPEMPPLPPGVLAEFVANVDRVFDEKTPITMHVHGPSPQGLRAFHTRIVPELDDRGEVATVLVVSRDVTDLEAKASPAK